MLLVTAGHLTTAEAWRLVSEGSRSVMRLPHAGPTPGARAELVAIRAASLGAAIAEAPHERYVIHAGRLVARSTTRVEIAAESVTEVPA